MTIDEALCNIKQGYGIPRKHDTLTTIIEYVKKAEPCEDAIRRQAVIDLVAANRTEVSWTNVIMYSPFYKGLTQLPPVQPKAKTGHWIVTLEDWNKWTCSECGFSKRTDVHVRLGYKFCPNCGAKMESEDKE